MCSPQSRCCTSVPIHEFSGRLRRLAIRNRLEGKARAVTKIAYQDSFSEVSEGGRCWHDELAGAQSRKSR